MRSEYRWTDQAIEALLNAAPENPDTWPERMTQYVERARHFSRAWEDAGMESITDVKEAIFIEAAERNMRPREAHISLMGDALASRLPAHDDLAHRILTLLSNENCNAKAVLIAKAPEMVRRLDALLPDTAFEDLARAIGGDPAPAAADDDEDDAPQEASDAAK